MSKKKANYMDAINHWMLFCERDRLETRIKRLLTARNKWRKRARDAEARLDAVADREVAHTRATIADAQRKIGRTRAELAK